MRGGWRLRDEVGKNGCRERWEGEWRVRDEGRVEVEGWGRMDAERVGRRVEVEG